MALEEERQALRRCYEELEAQRIALEARVATAAAEVESAAAEARNARTLQQEGYQAKEALHQLHRKAKDVRHMNIARTWHRQRWKGQIVNRVVRRSEVTDMN